jgi:hypothetical protein
MDSQTWEAISTDRQMGFLESFDSETLAKQFNKSTEFFDNAKTFFKGVPRQTGDPKPIAHNPPKDLVVSARRDLSFYEANFELIDNSIDAWRRTKATRDLQVTINYDLQLLTGVYRDDAGGMEEPDVYKVFIPGETTNRNFDQNVIGSFGMGAKKGIFRLTDGAKVISCQDAACSYTSEVPEKWEADPNWMTKDGRAEPTVVGTTTIYMFKLFAPPADIEIGELVKRAEDVYAPLLGGWHLPHKLRLKINNLEAKAKPDIKWSGAAGIEPRFFNFNHTFRNFLNTGHDITLNFSFKCGLAQKGSGAKDKLAEPDWGVDVYGNGRLIERYLKEPFGFGTRDMARGTAGNRYIRAQLFINGHSFAIPWDTHKREYLDDHLVSLWLQKKLRPIIRKYVEISNKFATETIIRNTILETTPFVGEPKVVAVPADNKIPTELLPSWTFRDAAPTKPTRPPEPEPAVEDEEGDAEDESQAEIVETALAEKVVSIRLSPAEFDEFLERFDVDAEDALAMAIRECLISGVAFVLEPEQFVKALAKMKTPGGAGELSERIRLQLVSKL